MFNKTSEVELFRNNVITLVKTSFSSPSGRDFERDVVRHVGAVSIVALLEDCRRVVLLHQFRAPLGKSLLEIPAGKRDVAGEPPETTAVRELEEELGLRCTSLFKLGEFENSPGFTDEHSYSYLARGLSLGTPDPQSVEESEAKVVVVDLERVERLISNGVITDAKTIIGLYRAIDFLACDGTLRAELYPKVWVSGVAEVQENVDSKDVIGWADSLEPI